MHEETVKTPTQHLSLHVRGEHRALHLILADKASIVFRSTAFRHPPCLVCCMDIHMRSCEAGLMSCLCT